MPFAQHDMLNRGRRLLCPSPQSRAPNGKNWMTLTAQLAEFELRCEAR